MQGGKFAEYIRRCWFHVLGGCGRFFSRARAVVGPRTLRRGRTAYSMWFTSLVCSLFDPPFLPCDREYLMSILARNHRAHSGKVSRVLGGSRLASFALVIVDVDRRLGCR